MPPLSSATTIHGYPVKYLEKLSVRSSEMEGRLVNSGGSPQPTHSAGSPLLMRLCMTFSSLRELFDMLTS